MFIFLLFFIFYFNSSPEDMEGAIMFTTTFPCETSIPLIKGKKIKEVVCSDQSDMTDKHFLKEIELTQVK